MLKKISFLFFLFPFLLKGQTISVIQSYVLPDILAETSGLQFVENKLISFNDDTDTCLYVLDTLGSIIDTIPVFGVSNSDWEDIAQNSNYLFIGDFGNNSSGNRQDLHILRILKSSLTSTLIVDTIYFSYEDQLDFSPVASNTTNFDCEAMIASEDSLYLFTKQWGNLNTTCYSLPIVPGVVMAKKMGVFNCNGLITGADFFENGNRLVLSGYSEGLQPFLLLFSDFNDHLFFQGQALKVGLNLPFHQVEGISALDDNYWFLSNEKFSYSGVVNVSPAIHKINLQSLWTLATPENNSSDFVSVHPCQTNSHCLQLSLVEDSQIIVFSIDGRVIYLNSYPAGEHQISVNDDLVFIRIYSKNIDFTRLFLVF